jgi:hypothetical protein
MKPLAGSFSWKQLSTATADPKTYAQIAVSQLMDSGPAVVRPDLKTVIAKTPKQEQLSSVFP